MDNETSLTVCSFLIPACDVAETTKSAAAGDETGTVLGIVGLFPFGDLLKPIGKSPKRSHAGPSGALACSFTGGTLVRMADGSSKPISKVRVGDKVLATDPETGKRVARPVKRVFRHKDTVVDLKIDGQIITTTEDHPFWNATDGEFQRADQVDAEDFLLDADGRQLPNNGLSTLNRRRETAYNLEIAEIHTYHVGSDGVLVHYTCWGDLDQLSQSGARTVSGDLTRAGQKLERHQGGLFPRVSGSQAQKSQQGQDVLDDILTHPGTIDKPITAGNFKGGRYYIQPSGRGAVFNKSGEFEYFGEFTVPSPGMI